MYLLRINISLTNCREISSRCAGAGSYPGPFIELKHMRGSTNPISPD